MEKKDSMHLNGFDVSLTEAQEEDSDGYAILEHGQSFKIRLHNSHKNSGICKPSDAEIYVQGKYCGTFRVPYGQTVVLERPLNDSGRFTAYKNGTSDAVLAGIDPNSEDNGLIKVVWKPGHYQQKIEPEVYWPKAIYNEPRIEWTYFGNNDNFYDINSHETYRNIYDTNTSTSYCYSGTSSSSKRGRDLVGGGVGLSGHSNQTFKKIDSLQYDEGETVIYLRIAFRDNKPRPIKAVHRIESNKPRPLK